MSAEVNRLLEKAVDGNRLSPEEGLKILESHDLVSIGPMLWHQFRAAADAPLGFLCMVEKDRDRPQLPGPEELAALKQNPMIAEFLGADG